MQLTISEEGKRELFPSLVIPQSLQQYLISPHDVWVLEGFNVSVLLQGLSGKRFKGCRAWYSRYIVREPAVLSAKGPEAMLELRIAWRGSISGVWDQIIHTLLPEGYFSLSFAPYTVTRAVFDTPGHYETFDLHLSPEDLLAMGIDFQALYTFLNRVNKGNAAELSATPFRCPNPMLDAVRSVLRADRETGGAGAVLLDNHLENILIYALRTMSMGRLDEPVLSLSDIEALHHVCDLIRQSLPIYPGNDRLVAQALPTLNRFKLNYGFQQLFHKSPYAYFLFLRLEEARRLLEQGKSVSDVAYELAYQTPTTFIRTFKKHVGLTPKQYQMGH